MYKLLVVDDEYYIRKGLINTIRWDLLNIEVVAEATNGADAFELTKSLEPDIVITDINMPQMSGIDYIQAVRDVYPKIKIVIISGYAEFEYAQKAIDLDVCSYLLKPLEEEDIHNTFANVVQELDEEKKLSEKLCFLEQQFDEKLTMMRKSFVSDVAEGFYDEEQEIQAYANMARIQLSPCYCCAVFYLKRQSKNESVQSHRNRQMLILGIEQTSHDLLSKDFDVLETVQHPDEAVSLIGLRGELTRAKRETLRKSLEKLSCMVKSSFQAELYVGIGMPCDNLSGLARSYHEAKAALNYRTSFGEEYVIFLDNITAISNLSYAYPIDKERYILRCMDKGEAEKLPEAIRAFTKELVRQKLPKQGIQTSILTLMQVLARREAELGMESQQSGLTQSIHAIDTVAGFESINQINDWLLQRIRQSMIAFEELQTSNLKDVMRKAKEYIKQNFVKPDLTISSIAEHLYLSPNYFSNLFTKEYNEPCSGYITRLRLEEAQRLLRQTNLRISDIGVAVGYENSQYFCTLFKKNVGKTPAEYRNQ